MKITKDIFQVGGNGLTAPGDAAIYLINFGRNVALVDAGCGWALGRLFKNILDCGVKPEQLKYLLITHCHYDHSGGGWAVKERTNCQVVAHELESGFLENGDNMVTGAKWYGGSLQALKIDRKLSGDRERINMGDKTIEAIHTPGHSPGSVVYLTESEGLKVLFGQDVHGPLDESLLSNRKDYNQSLNLLLSLEADILCEGHFGVFKGKKKVADFIRSFLEL